ncbi:MAG: hypothetical protein IJW23_13960 [Lentisphaeria bacterium]|nr:hypothetical protein [Lentisphaeria bacterium]
MWEIDIFRFQSATVPDFFRFYKRGTETSFHQKSAETVKKYYKKVKKNKKKDCNFKILQYVSLIA